MLSVFRASVCRRILVVLVLVVIAVFGAPAPRSQSESVARTGQARSVQVVAHPDDDVIFMNPDLAASVRSGDPTTSIYLTAGESDLANPAAYAAQRQRGTRAAFARMAGVANRWDRAVLPLPSMRSVEMYTLRERRAVRLVFLNLPDDNDPNATGGKHALTRLWEDDDVRVRALVPEGSPLTEHETYDREAVIETIAALYRRFAPTLVRTQDPAPDPRYQPQWGIHHDHPDHVMTAHFARAAESRTRSRARILHYRDYNLADAPSNLASKVVRDKRNIFRAYDEHDPMVSVDEPYTTWLASMRYRWGRGAHWAARDRFGRLQVAFVAGQRLFVDNGEARTATAMPDLVPVEGSPALLPDQRGDLTLLVQESGTGDIWMTRQDHATGAWSGRATNLRRPKATVDGQVVTQVGVPMAVVGTDGRVIVAVSNERGGVSVRAEGHNGTWGPGWLDIGGNAVQERVSAVVDRTGSVHVFAPGADGLLCWRQTGKGFEFVPALLRYRPTGQVALARAGTATYAAFHDAHTGRLVVLTHHGHGSWEVTATLDGPAGGSPPALTVVREHEDEIPMLATRNHEGETEIVRLPGGASPPERRVLPGRVTDRPAFTPDGAELVGFSDAGQLLLTEHQPGGPPRPWATTSRWAAR